MKLKVFLRTVMMALILAALALPVFAQKAIVLVSKYPLAAVTKGADGDLWTAAQPSLNHSSALIAVRKTGTVDACTLTIYTGQSLTTATSAINDANSAFSCAAATNKIITNLDRYFQMTVSSWSGTGSITFYVTLTNGAGWNLNATLSGVSQSTGSGDPSTHWMTRVTDGSHYQPTGDAVARRSYVQHTDGTNSTPSADASARSIYTIPNDGSAHNQPAGDAQARAQHVIPGNGTNADKQMLDGVGALGAGVKQVATLGTLSAAVASATRTEVVAVNAGARVLLGVIIETATNAAGIVTVSTGTGTNCGTGTAVKVTFGIATASSPLPVGYYPVNALVAAGSAICLTTDAATTSARVLTQ